MTDDELATWRSDWSTLGEATPPEALVSHVRGQSRRQLRAAIGEVSASVFLVVTSVLLVLRQPIAPVFAFAMAMCLYVGVWLTYFFTIRVGSWGHEGEAVRDYLVRARRLHGIELRWARFARACTIALMVFLAVWSPWLVITKWQLYRAAPWRGVVGFGIASCILALVWLWNRRKLRALAVAGAELDERVRAFEDGIR